METIDTYFKTENKHWNETVFEIYTDAIISSVFTNAETPVKLFDEVANNIYNNRETPADAVTKAVKELKSLEQPQQLFLLEKFANYYKHTVFDGDELTEVHTLLKSYIKRMKPEKPKAGNLRETLKGIVMDELEALPETIKELEPMQRLNIVCKLMPFVMPKVESVHFEKGEGNGFSFDI